jgi:hypothetical protein
MLFDTEISLLKEDKDERPIVEDFKKSRFINATVNSKALYESTSLHFQFKNSLLSFNASLPSVVAFWRPPPASIFFLTASDRIRRSARRSCKVDSKPTVVVVLLFLHPS